MVILTWILADQVILYQCPHPHRVFCCLGASLSRLATNRKRWWLVASIWPSCRGKTTRDTSVMQYTHPSTRSVTILIIYWICCGCLTLDLRVPVLQYTRRNWGRSSIYDEDHHHGETPMLTTFTLLVVTGGILRLALGWGLHRRYQLDLSVPQALAGVLVMLAGLPDILKPFSFPLPLGFTLGALLPDLLFRRR